MRTGSARRASTYASARSTLGLVLAQGAGAVGSGVAVAKEKVDLFEQLGLEEQRGRVVALAQRVPLEDVAVQNFVKPHRARQHGGF